GVHPVPLAHIRSQIAAIFDDFPVAAVKVGMLGSRAVVRLVARELRVRRPAHCIIDPVMIATSGARLLDDNAIEALRDELIPLADVLTPNLPEAAALLNLEQPITSAAKANAAAAQLRALGARAVLLKGGHGLGKTLVDRLYDANGVLEIRHPRLRLQGHGTGCSLASALAAELAKGRTLRAATKHAVDYVNRGLRAGYQPGKADLTVLG
ncbi:MAG: hydroxymethylpyrimidine/phosphomethylpyrimidine kinase, partial [Xanthomonadales bacterium]|nr:hydroxymethylpyrimidine/phosphomethylpyrimidine kinase [Xanthomonadales bacterium]